MNLEWSVPHTIVSLYGELKLNVADAATGEIFRVQYETYKIVPSLRVTQDNISQTDGSVLHPRWKTGVVATIQVALEVMLNPTQSVGESRPACEGELRAMEDLLLLHLNAMRKLAIDPQRLRWTPTGYGQDRMLEDVQLLQIWDPAYELDGTGALVAFALESPFPYGIDATQTTTTIPSSGGGTMGGFSIVTNAGTSPESPVVKVEGPFLGFTLTNTSDLDEFGAAKSVVYDSTRPGAVAVHTGHYAEIDFFRGTIYLDGSGANLVAGLDPTLTDFWALQPGNNGIQITGADCIVLSNNAWA